MDTSSKMAKLRREIARAKTIRAERSVEREEGEGA
jgi:ribosomal protein L29